MAVSRNEVGSRAARATAAVRKRKQRWEGRTDLWGPGRDLRLPLREVGSLGRFLKKVRVGKGTSQSAKTKNKT